MKKDKWFHNFWLKILAFLTAIVLWLVVINISDPVISTSISGIQVEIENADMLTKEHKVYEILENTNTISVSITAKRTIVDYLNASNIRATADMEELNEADGTIRIRVEANRYNNQIESLKAKTEYLKIKIEDMKSVQFPIEADIKGKPQEGYVVGNVSMNQNIVYISGPESVVSKIFRVATEVSVEGMGSSISTNMDLKYYDTKGEIVEKSRLSQNISDVDLKVEILKTKEVPIKVEVSGTPATGYGLSGVIRTNPTTVLVAGKVSALNQIEQIQIPEARLNVDGFQTNLNTVVDISSLLPDEIILADKEYNGEVHVDIEVVELDTKTVELPKTQISITGVPQGYSAAFGTNAEAVTFDVMGLTKVLENFDIKAVTASVDVEAYMEENDLSRLTENSYLMPVSMKLPDGVTQKLPVNVSIKINKAD